MVTRAKPLDSAGVDLRASVKTVDKWLKATDYKAITDCVPLKPGADVAQLKADIRIAAVWYLLRYDLREATATRVRATLQDLHDKYKAALDATKRFPPVMRPMLRADDQDQTDALQRDAWLSPTAIIERELEQLVAILRKRIWRIPVKRGQRKSRYVDPKRVLKSAWKNATGKPPVTQRNREAFLAFEVELTARINKHLKETRLPIPSENQLIKASARK